VVEDIEQMSGVVEELLADRERLQTLSQAGRRSVREQVNWPRYVECVSAALAAIEARPADPAANARATFGARLMEMRDERVRAIQRVGELDAELADATARVRYLDRELASAHEALAELGRRLDDASARARVRGAHAIRARTALAAAILRRSPN
jgi:DNA repair exonuclease SbcCD ATPase subunit